VAGSDSNDLGTGSASGEPGHTGERGGPAPTGARAARAFAGHPVDVATGEQFTAAHDVELPGVAPLVFRRVYNTAFLPRASGSLGPGWVHAFEATLERDLDGYVFEGHDGDRVDFNDVDGDFAAATPGATLLNRSASMELRREGEQLVVYHWHDVDEPVQRYVFNAHEGDRMPLAARLLPSGQGLRIERDRLGRPLSVTQTKERRRLYLSYDSAGRLVTLHLAFAAQTVHESRLVARYEYDSRSRLVAAHDANGAARRYEYDDQHRLVAEIGRRGGIFRMRYDAQGRCIETTGEAGYRKCTFNYEPGRTTRVTDSLGFDTLYQYNARGQVEHRILPNGAKYFTEIDEYGRVVGEVDPLGKATCYRYDDIGRVAEKTWPNGAKVRYEYDEYHQPRRITEPDGAVWEFRYERGALVEVKDPFERRSVYYRNRHNELIGAFTSSGQEIRIATDDHVTEEVVTDQFGVIRQCSLDLHLNPTATSNAEGPLGAAEYDPLGRLIRGVRPDGTTREFEYDAEGDLIRLTDARGGVWLARLSPYGDCLEKRNPLGARQRFTWDTEGRLISIENPKNERARFEYDSVGNVIVIQHFDGSREQLRYDLAGRLAGRVRPDGARIEMARDDVGNIVKVNVAGTQGERTFKYDQCGDLLEAKTADTKVEFERTIGGRITAEVQSGHRIEYRYDSRGYLRERSFDASMAGPVTFEHDARGRLRRFVAQSGQGQTFEYDLRNQCIERVLGFSIDSLAPTAADSHARRETRKYDLQGRLRHQSIGKLSARTFEYDSEGSLVELVDQLRGHRRYRYDAADHLIDSTSATFGSHLYGYDANGNLTAKDFDNLSYTTGDRLESVENRRDRTAFERNVNGEMSRQTSTQRDDQYTWDGFGQLTRVLHRNGSETTFVYDALGRRIDKVHRQATERTQVRRTQYFWSGDDLLAERTGNSITEYAMRGSIAEALWEDGKIRHVVSSQQGTPQELIDENGRIVWHGSFDDWGKLVSEEGEADCRLRLPGQLFDEETGLHYNRSRYFSPDTGQFVSPDPIAFAGGIHFFRFAPNAVGWIDPLGLECGSSACAARKASEAEGEAARTEGRRGMAAGLSDGENTVSGRSTGAGGGALDPAVQAAYDAVPPDQRSPFHSKCAEGRSLSAALAAGVNPAGATSVATVIGGPNHGTVREACSSCAHVLNQLGVKDGAKGGGS
jgi:RHS repeat-associated protein